VALLNLLGNVAVAASSAPTHGASVSSMQKRRDQCVIPEEDPNWIINGLDDEDELSRMMGEGERDEDDRGDDDMEDGGESQSQPH
jgi:hypothetical protein